MNIFIDLLGIFIPILYDITSEHIEFIEKRRMRNRILECFNRANRSYREITKYKAPVMIAERQVQELLSTYARSQQLISYEKLQEDIAKICLINDSEYIILLSMAIFNVFAVEETPKFIA